MSSLNERSLAQKALDDVWQRLTTVINEARRLQAEAVRDPRLYNDARLRALDRWLFLFADELGDVQAIHDAGEAGSRLRPRDLWLAQETGERLLEVVLQPPVVARSAADESLSSDRVTRSAASFSASDESLTSDEASPDPIWQEETIEEPARDAGGSPSELGALGRHAEALAGHQALLADQLRVLGADHPDTLRTRGNIASELGALGRHADALAGHQALLADQLRVLGADHPDTLRTRGNIASELGAAGRHAEALNDLARASKTLAGDLLVSRDEPISVPSIKLPGTVMAFAVEPKTKGDEEKVFAALRRLQEEDPTIDLHR
jgi:hypothetical protein